jgi:hypothetical protein
MLTRPVSTARPASLAQRRIAQAEWRARRAELGLSSPRESDPDSPPPDPVSVDPSYVRFGEPEPRRRQLKASERRFMEPVDRWLDHDGWVRGAQAKAAVRVEWVSQVEKKRILNAFRSELKARGWLPLPGKGSPVLVTTRFSEDLRGQQWFTWWATPAAVALGRPPKPPKPPAGRSGR